MPREEAKAIFDLIKPIGDVVNTLFHHSAADLHSSIET
jgi:hypothetical protein